ncbi:hypothetical protein HK102_002732 [Quaeritorhiza haematococci]|nr:hypothetical protein HK102_002732 [Quaeritorhiza haematococci]
MAVEKLQGHAGTLTNFYGTRTTLFLGNVNFFPIIFVVKKRVSAKKDHLVVPERVHGRGGTRSAFFAYFLLYISFVPYLFALIIFTNAIIRLTDEVVRTIQIIRAPDAKEDNEGAALDSQEAEIMLQHLTRFYKANMALANFRLALADLRLAVAEYNIALVTHTIRCPRCVARLPCNEVPTQPQGTADMLLAYAVMRSGRRDGSTGTRLGRRRAGAGTQTESNGIMQTERRDSIGSSVGSGEFDWEGPAPINFDDHHEVDFPDANTSTGTNNASDGDQSDSNSSLGEMDPEISAHLGNRRISEVIDETLQDGTGHFAVDDQSWEQRRLMMTLLTTLNLDRHSSAGSDIDMGSPRPWSLPGSSRHTLSAPSSSSASTAEMEANIWNANDDHRL